MSGGTGEGRGVECETLPRNVIRLYAGLRPDSIHCIESVYGYEKLLRSSELYTYILYIYNIRLLFAQQTLDQIPRRQNTRHTNHVFYDVITSLT